MGLVASDFGTGQVFLSMLWFFLFFIWIWLLIMVFSDIFRSHDLRWSQGDLGDLRRDHAVPRCVRLPARRGGKMHEHAVEAAAPRTGGSRVHPERGEHGLEPDRSARAAREPEGAGGHRRRRVPEDEGEGRRKLSRAGVVDAKANMKEPPNLGGLFPFPFAELCRLCSWRLQAVT